MKSTVYAYKSVTGINSRHVLPNVEGVKVPRLTLPFGAAGEPRRATTSQSGI